MATVKINGLVFEGNDITMVGDKIFVDGVEQKEVNTTDRVVIKGNVRNVVSDRAVEVNGDITGNVETKGSVNCDDVGGDITAGGSVNCDDVRGSVTAGGSINWVSKAGF